MKADKILLSCLFVFSCMGMVVTTVNSKEHIKSDDIPLHKYSLQFDPGQLSPDIDSLNAEILIHKPDFANIQQ